MTNDHSSGFDDRFLTRYLLGALPEEEAGRLDELSIADDALAARLHDLENGLVDDFVTNQLFGEDLELFKLFYLSSARRRQKVKFAALLQLVDSGATASEPPGGPDAVEGDQRDPPDSKGKTEG